MDVVSSMKSDIEIAQAARPRLIVEIAGRAGLVEDELELYGRYKAMVLPAAFDRLRATPNGKLVLVTAMTPTVAGEGKTTTTVGLGQALCAIGERAVVTIREAATGPVFGVKGAAGAGFVVALTGDIMTMPGLGKVSTAERIGAGPDGRIIGLD